MGNNDELKNRLRQILEVNNSNVSKITEGGEIKRSTLSAQLNGNSAVSAETLIFFLKKFKDISAEWLMKGVGSMFRECNCNTDPNAPFMLSEPPITERIADDNDEEKEFLRQQLRLEQQKNSVLQQQLDLYNHKV